MSRCFKSISCPNKHVPSGFESPQYRLVHVLFLVCRCTDFSYVGRKIMTLLTVMVTAFIVLGGFSSPLTEAATRKTGEELLLFYGNDVRGQIDPCG